MTAWMQITAYIAVSIGAVAFLWFVSRAVWLLLTGQASRREQERRAAESRSEGR